MSFRSTVFEAGGRDISKPDRGEILHDLAYTAPVPDESPRERQVTATKVEIRRVMFVTDAFGLTAAAAAESPERRSARRWRSRQRSGAGRRAACSAGWARRPEARRG